MTNSTEDTTHFGFKTVAVSEKTAKVGQVFESVAEKYDLMNDLMSFGVHRLWKKFAIDLCHVRSGQRILDLAGGTGDLTARLAPIVGDSGHVVLADINSAMLEVGRDRLIDQGFCSNISTAQVNAENLPFAEHSFDRIFIGFGLRNVTNQLAALKSMYYVLKPGGQLIVLEFSKPTTPWLKKLYELYSFQLLPKLGKWVAKDEDSYRYLVESIAKHPNQEEMVALLSEAAFEDVNYHNLSGGIVAIHRGYKY